MAGIWVFPAFTGYSRLALLAYGVAVAVTILILYYVACAIYRLTFHPLHRFPGPRLRAISQLPQSLAGVRGREAYAVREIHARYGEVVRIAPDTLSFTAAAAWNDIYGHAATKRFRKHGYFEIRADAQPLLTANDEDYTRQRAALSHGFSDRAIQGQEVSLTKHVNGFLEKLEAKAKKGEDVDMCQWANFLTFDIIGEFLLSTRFGCVSNSQNHPWVTLMIRWMHAVGYAVNASACGLLAPFLMVFVNFKDLKGIKTHLDLSAAKVRERLETNEDPDKADLWTYILRNQGEKNSISLAEMEVNAAALVSAATAPIADVLCGTLYHLARNPDILDSVRDELRGQVEFKDRVTISETSKVPYLNAVINESMRCYPSFPGGTRRVTPAGGAFVADHFVPGGTIVCVYQLSSFTLSNNFALPDRFLPSRWLPIDHPDRPQATLSDKHDSFQPFGVGPRACLGKGLAYAELKLILARFVMQFDFKLVDERFALDEQKAYLFRDRPPLNIKLRVRKH